MNWLRYHTMCAVPKTMFVAALRCVTSSLTPSHIASACGVFEQDPFGHASRSSVRPLSKATITAAARLRRSSLEKMWLT